jgi:hypothetical protein
MQSLKILAICAFVIFFISCGDEMPESTADTFGTFEVEFDHYVGENEMQLVEAGSTDYAYSNGVSQAFNITLFGYYISGIKLEGPDGAIYEDKMNVSANASEVTGYYQVLEDVPASKVIALSNVPSGKYNKITLIIGIPEEGLSEGAGGGIFDPAEGAWLWNWNAGYVAMKIEGEVQSASLAWVAHGTSGFAYHVGGWKDIAPAEGQAQSLVNNVKTISIELGTNVMVSPKVNPSAHLVVDVLKILNGANLDFTVTPTIHSPAAGKALADQFEKAFLLDHVHQN